MELIKTPKIENVRMLDRFNTRKPSQGTLYVTATHLIFVDPEGRKETWILHMHIASVDKMPLSTTGSPLQIRCKTFLSVTFIIPKERDCMDVFTTLNQLSQPVHMEDLYCYHYTSSTEDIPKVAGWNFFDLQAEYQRMAIPNEHWSLTLMNKDYELCDTYPRYIYVPSTASTTVLLGSSRFRSKGRLPVLSYYHKSKAAICRCSQPLSGFSARCVEDELMLDCVRRANPNSSFMYVVDTRPRINALANRAAGKGYENENFYENIKFQFLGIENIHVMRSSLTKLLETCELKTPSMNSFLSSLESCGWLRHIKAILDTSWFIARSVEEGVTVVVHCSDGWDRTSQVCSLAALLLDPYYRTIQGFQALIEKEWLSFGHKFTDRCGFIQSEQKETSPVFTQFVDCSYQLAQQFPSAFQFNERFLLSLHDHVYSCQFGTFVGNCEKDRLDLRLPEKTYSLWGYMANHMNEYLNPTYDMDKYPKLLIPNLIPQNIRFWRGLYCRFESGIHPREPLGDLLLATKDHTSSMEDHIKLLQKRISTLKEKLSTEKTESQDGYSDIEEKLKNVDNKYLYSKNSYLDTACSIDSNHNPTDTNKRKPSPLTLDGITVDQLTAELNSVALDWKTLRNTKECICSTPFDHFSRKYHCWRCGDVFCTRCIDKHISLPGHLSQRIVPVCRPCYNEIQKSSFESP